jgi:hypothetical protein
MSSSVFEVFQPFVWSFTCSFASVVTELDMYAECLRMEFFLQLPIMARRGLVSIDDNWHAFCRCCVLPGRKMEARYFQQDVTSKQRCGLFYQAVRQSP